jgi:hypothetical protein
MSTKKQKYKKYKRRIKMKSLKSKVILSALVLIFALVATIGSTFAWFTVSSTVTASSLTLNVISEESLLIKVAAPTATAIQASSHTVASLYKSALTAADITASGMPYEAVATAYLKPVTAVQSDYASINGSILKPLTSILANPTRTLGTALDLDLSNASTDVNVPGGGVVQLRFWVLSQGATQQDLYVSSFSIATSQGAPLNTAVNAMRMSVWAGDFATMSPASPYIYSQGLDYGFEWVSGAAGYFATDIYTGVGPTATLNGFNKISDLIYGYSGTGSSAPAFASMASHKTANNTADVITTLSQGTPQLVTVTFFIEGWDAQMNNDIMLAQFAVSFGFSISDHI